MSDLDPLEQQQADERKATEQAGLIHTIGKVLNEDDLRGEDPIHWDWWLVVFKMEGGHNVSCYVPGQDMVNEIALEFAQPKSRRRGEAVMLLGYMLDTSGKSLLGHFEPCRLLLHYEPVVAVEFYQKAMAVVIAKQSEAIEADEDDIWKSGEESDTDGMMED